MAEDLFGDIFFCYMVLFEKGLSIFFIKNPKALHQQRFVINDLMPAERYDKAWQSTSSDNGDGFTELGFHSVDDAVDHSGAAVHDAAAHTVDGILANDLLGNVKADGGQLGRFAA